MKIINRKANPLKKIESKMSEIVEKLWRPKNIGKSIG
jgi:hypothetical protein